MIFTQADWVPCATEECSRKELSAEGLCKDHHTGPEQFVRVCNLPECSTRYHQSGYCVKHWGRFKAHGDPRGMSPKMVDWTVPQYCLDCKVELRKSNTKDDGTGRPVRCAGGVCPNCRTRRSAIKNGVVSRAVVFDDNGQSCRLCKTYFPFSEYRKAKDLVSGHVTACKVCEKIYRYGLNRRTYEELLVAQGNACAICSRPMASVASGVRRGEVSHVDHDHGCCSAPGTACDKCRRGLLCTGCNVGLGHFRDSPVMLRSAAAYLRMCAERGPLVVERFIPGPRAGGGSLVFDTAGQTCRVCRQHQPFAEFGPARTNVTGHLGICKTCEYVTRRGITRAGFEALLLSQGHNCPACTLPLTMGTATRYARELHLDHNHKCCEKKTKGCCLRGALHATCNLGLGALGDDPGTLELAATYLERHNL